MIKVTLANLKTIDLSPQSSDFATDVLAGLEREQKSISPKYFYDRRGSEIFDQICQLDEYYVTRTEMSIIRSLSSRIDANQSPLLVVELGGASSYKFRNLLQVLPEISAYMPIDISRDALFEDAFALARDFPNIDVTAVCADYLQIESLSAFYPDHNYTPMVFFPGSTIGNLSEAEALQVINFCQKILGGRGYLLLGCDLVKPESILIPAYADKNGVTANFNKNLLHRINNELGGDFDLNKFRHVVRYNQMHSRIEMHLVSTTRQTVTVKDRMFTLAAGESIHTENSRKFTKDALQRYADACGFSIDQWWLDERKYYALALLRTGDPHWRFQMNP
ncbi:MAG: L-histidine N(alpha)-methyltransferase [Deltaproteobacteria bacterium]|nr:L-histidine N(alpha)-methyltransferase [Deltaproteobacteria bacterium]